MTPNHEPAESAEPQHQPAESAEQQHQPAEPQHQPAESAEPRLAPTFAELGAHPEIVHALAELGITTAFPIQESTLPLALDGADLIGQAKTGTGKTLGFGIPLLQRVDAPTDETPKGRAPQALVVTPTRELAIQVAGDLQKAGARLGIRVLTVYGGRAYEPQIEALTEGVEVVVGTPGRLIDLAQQRHLRLDEVRVLVLDEADEMLDMGFLPDVERIVERLPKRRQTMLFSATMPAQIVGLARRYMDNPTHIRAADPLDMGITVEAIEQHVWRAHPLDKDELVARILQAEGRSLTIIFTQYKRRAQRVQDELTDRGFAVAAVHGDLGQAARERALRAFRTGKVDVLVATDVAARGIDVTGVTHVINYECPDDEKTYLHRIGRTGRAGADGVAITFVDWEDTARWKMINKALGLAFTEPVESYSSSDHVYSELSIPTGAKGRLPRSQRVRAGLQAEELEDIGETGGRRSASGRRTAEPGGRAGSGDGRQHNRNRRRTRGGPGGQEPASRASQSTSGPGKGDQPPSVEGKDAGAQPRADSDAGPRKPRRRRRRRSTTASQSGAPASAEG